MGLRVIEIIPNTIQGEGKYSGAACQFIRLSGCHSHCKWCDTKESWNVNAGKLMTETEIADELSGIVNVCITGGDPLLQDCGDLVSLLKKRGYQVHVEVHSIGEVQITKPKLRAANIGSTQLEPPEDIKTKTTEVPSWLWAVDHITFCPKPHLKYDMRYLNLLGNDFFEMSLKLVVFPTTESFDDAEEWIRQSSGMDCFQGLTYIQCACDNNGEIIEPQKIAELFIARKFPEHVRLTCQMHKIIKFK